MLLYVYILISVYIRVIDMQTTQSTNNDLHWWNSSHGDYSYDYPGQSNDTNWWNSSHGNYSYDYPGQSNDSDWFNSYDDYNYDYNYVYDYSDPNFYDLDGEDCKKVQTCGNSGSVSCSCDVMCDLYQDCCSGADASLLYGYVISQKQKELSQFLGCEYIPSVYEMWYVSMINKCPVGTNADIDYRCRTVDPDNTFSSTPVSGKDSRLPFRNMYCAMCNGEEYTFWAPELQCRWKEPYTGNVSIDELMKLDACFVLYKPRDNNVGIRECYPFISSCPNGENDNYAVNGGCELGENRFVFTKNEIFKNKECFLCSNYSSDTNVSCSKGHYNFTAITVSRSVGRYSFKLLFDLQSGNAKSYRKELFAPEEENQYDLDDACLNGQIYDPLSSTCRQILCPDEYVFKNRKCTKYFSKSHTNLHSTACVMIRFNESEFDVINETSIRIRLSNKTYQNVVFRNNTAYVCHDNHVTNRYLQNVDDGQGIVSFVCGVISMVCLLLTTIIFMIPKLRNMPGKIIVCLSLSLCTAQMLFVFGSGVSNDSLTCKIFSVVEHYLYLCSFCWMTIMAFDVFSTFRVSFKNAEDNAKRFIVYCLYALGVPLLLIFAGILTNEFTNWSYSPKYGENVCWISNPKGLMVFFLIPLGIMMFFNVLFYTLSVLYICRTKRKSSSTLQTTMTCEIVIYLKLSTVMGLTWVLGYLATTANNEVMWYVFILFHGLQGLLIFCSFVLNKKVLGIITTTFRKTDTTKSSGKSCQELSSNI